MIGINGFRGKPSLGFLFTLIDSFLIFGGILMGGYLRFWSAPNYLLEGEYPVLKIMVTVAVVHLSFYYFDLYNVRVFHERKATVFLLFESLGVSAILMALVYYLFPVFFIGRGVLAFSLSIVFLLAFVWRQFYAWVSGTRTFRERILIIGTGEQARKIEKEIAENGNGSFEIVGFIDESGQKVGRAA